MADSKWETTAKAEDKSKQEKKDIPAPPKKKTEAGSKAAAGIFATVEEAVEGAGTRVLSFLESRAHILTVEEREEHLAALQIEGEAFPYAGPYTDEEDARNSWTAYQAAAPVTP